MIEHETKTKELICSNPDCQHVALVLYAPKCVDSVAFKCRECGTFNSFVIEKCYLRSHAING